MKIRIAITTLLLTAISFSQKIKHPTIKQGKWTANLQISDQQSLPFLLIIHANKKEKKFEIKNGEESIFLEFSGLKQDSFIYRFPAFDSELVFKPKGKKQIQGRWINHNKTNYSIPFSATLGYKQRFLNSSLNNVNIDGRWEVTFEPNTPDSYKGVGIFNQNQNTVTGTFLTETGDYRYLEGNVTGDSLLLSCFDGSHAFLFKAKVNEKTMNGQFFSGKHWSCYWNAVENNGFKLTHPDSLTYVKENTESITFELKDLNNRDYHYPNEQTKNKVVIIQLMGTWCPNCLDESRYFKELYDKYHDRGLEIISIGYEVGKTHEEHAAKILRFKEKMDMNFTFVVGGAANKGLAAQHFPMLNNITSFPTTIFIGRDGEVKRIHTGFNGPGTGVYYNAFKQSTETLLEELLKL